MSLFWIFCLSLVLSGAILYPWIQYLAKHGYENRLESHHLKKYPIPNGAGVVLVLILNGVGIPVSIIFHETILLTPMLLTIPLSFIGWVDDTHEVPIVQRFIIYCLSVLLGLIFLMPIGSLFAVDIFGSFTWVIEFIILFCLWLAFMNFFNFMDGMDGMSAMHMIVYGLGIVIWSVLYTLNIGFLSPFAVIIIGMGFGFLTWNFYPAKVYLGDSGSVPIGYFLGAFGVILFLLHFGAYAFILTLYYWGDAGFTLFFRMVKGEKFWESHNKHYFRQALDHLPEKAVFWRILLIEIVLLSFAVMSFYWDWWMLIPAVFWVMGWLIYFRRV